MSQLCQLAELLGQFPCRKSECQQNTKPLSTGAEQLTVEPAASHLELLEIRQSAPFRRDSASELVSVVNISADVEHLE